MPAAIPIDTRREGAYVVLEAHLPERPPRNIGVLLIDPATGRGWVRLRDHFDDIADSDDAEVLEALDQDLRERASAGLLESLEDTLSNAIRVTARETVAVDSYTRVLDRLFDQHVEPIETAPFRTHVPLYSLRAAAGGLGDEMESLAEDWVRAPEGVKVTPDLFVAHVTGRSMEPRIPDGSLNLFRLHPAGSRQNKILLIQRFGTLDATARYTVKRYTSRKVYREDGEWQHEQIRLEPLNPEYEAWDLEPESFAVVAEWLRVIE